MLFSVYTKDIQNSDTDASIKLFADDTNLFVHAKYFNSATQKSSKCLSDLNVWFLC